MEEGKISRKLLMSSIIISMLLWGVSWPSGKVLSHYCTLVNFTIYRYVVVILTLLPLLLIFKVKLRIKREGIPIVIAAGLLLALYNYFFFKGLSTGYAGAGGVLVTTLNPIMAYALGLCLQRKIPSRNESIGLIIGLVAGCVLLKIWSNQDLLFADGNIFFLVAAFTWAAMSKFTAKASAYGTSPSFSLWMYLVMLLCFLPFFDTKEFNTLIDTAGFTFWGNLFFSAGIVSALATTVYFYATTQLGAEKASSFIFIVPLAAAVSSGLALGEQIQPHTIAGGILGIVAVYMINKK